MNDNSLITNTKTDDFELKINRERALKYYHANRDKLLKQRREIYKVKGKKAKAEYYLKIKDNEDYKKKIQAYAKKKVPCPHCEKIYTRGYLNTHIKKFHS